MHRSILNDVRSCLQKLAVRHGAKRDKCWEFRFVGDTFGALLRDDETVGTEGATVYFLKYPGFDSQPTRSAKVVIWDGKRGAFDRVERLLWGHFRYRKSNPFWKVRIKSRNDIQSLEQYLERVIEYLRGAYRDSFDAGLLQEMKDDEGVAEAWDRRSRQVIARPGQRAFRNQLIDAYGGECAISGCSTIEALDAAHIHPVEKRGLDSVVNGLLLRTDLHRLFDAGLLWIDPAKFTVGLADVVKRGGYSEYLKQSIQLPADTDECCGPRTADTELRCQAAFDERCLSSNAAGERYPSVW